jgi:hypothetical protein
METMEWIRRIVIGRFDGPRLPMMAIFNRDTRQPHHPLVDLVPKQHQEELRVSGIGPIKSVYGAVNVSPILGDDHIFIRHWTTTDLRTIWTLAIQSHIQDPKSANTAPALIRQTFVGCILIIQIDIQSVTPSWVIDFLPGFLFRSIPNDGLHPFTIFSSFCTTKTDHRG